MFYRRLEAERLAEIPKMFDALYLAYTVLGVIGVSAFLVWFIWRDGNITDNAEKS